MMMTWTQAVPKEKMGMAQILVIYGMYSLPDLLTDWM